MSLPGYWVDPVTEAWKSTPHKTPKKRDNIRATHKTSNPSETGEGRKDCLPSPVNGLILFQPGLSHDFFNLSIHRQNVFVELFPVHEGNIETVLI